MSEIQQLNNSEIPRTEVLKEQVLQQANRLVRSTQNPPEWPGAQFLRPKNDDSFFHDLNTRFESHLSEFPLDEQGVTVDGVALDHAVLSHLQDPVAEDSESAQARGFWVGATQALDWIGITKDKWSSQSPDICALEALAAAEGVPTSRQSNHMHPEGFVGARVKSVLGKKIFDYGSVNGITRTDKGPTYLQYGKPAVKKELGQGYRKGVEVAFLHYVAVGQDKVRISQIEQLDKAFRKR